MGAYRRGGERSRSSLRDVYVARTVRESDGKFEAFLRSLGRSFGPEAMINGSGSTHLTFLESCGIAPHFRNKGYTPDDIKSFKVSLEQHLGDTLPKGGKVVKVDPEKPLIWMPGRNKSLAINVMPDDNLLAERTQIEAFLESHFGELPGLRDFEPHITLGRVVRRLTQRERTDPRVLLPNWLQTPNVVALNGLAVYLGRIQSDSRAQ